MGSHNISEKEKFWMAGWIRGIFCKQIVRKGSNTIYSRPATSPQKEIVSEEFIDMLNKYDIAYDEKYIWK